MCKVGIKQILSSLLLAGVLFVVTVTKASELNIGNAPLYLGTNIDPNVFFEVDDSGSMDWEILVSGYYYYYDYWKNNTTTEFVTNGMWRAYSSVDSTVEGSNCFGSRMNYAYIYNASDNLYQGACWYIKAMDYPEALDRDWRVRSSQFNAMYYDPSVTYLPWPGMSNADYTAVRSDPQSGSDGYNVIRNLGDMDFVYEIAIDDHGFVGTTPNGPGDATDGANRMVDLWDGRIRHTITKSTNQLAVEKISTAPASVMNTLPDCSLSDAQAAVQFLNCFGTSIDSTTIIAGANVDAYGRTIAEIKQNIANWYQYHRRRSFVAKGAIAEVIKANGSFRYGLSVISGPGNLFIKVPASTVTDYNSHNDGLLSDLFSFDWPMRGTPLRRGLEVVGDYYDAETVWSGVDEPIIEACQHNFAVLFTDGYWNGSDPSLGTVDADGDGVADSGGTIRSTVADVAKFYYDKDLNKSMDDEVRVLVDEENQIMHQHMESFTVAFGVTGNIPPNSTSGWWPDNVNNTGFSWGNPFTDGDPAKIDDLWHAAYNSNARYISARTPKQVTDSLVETLGIIEDKAGSSASVATNTGALSEGSRIYQARFHPANWSGQLYAYNLDAATGEIDNQAWDAGEILSDPNENPPSGRKIITYNETSNKGVNFTWPGNYRALTNYTLSEEQIMALLSVDIAPYPADTTNATEIAANKDFGAALVDYLRGDRSHEQSGSGYDFRTRGGVLGDIVNSNPQFMGKPRSRYPDEIESGSKYSAFVSANTNRRQMLYVGANDGMVHGFDANTGKELLAYIPSAVFKNLGNLADPRYSHRYFVDGSPALNDAYIGGKWRTILAGGLNGGGQGVYALDVTDPADFPTAPADRLVLFEFTDRNDVDLGLTYARPTIVKMNNNEWVAIFGNGYNNTAADGYASTTGRASLFIVSLENTVSGKPKYWKLDTGVGSSTSPNGLASVAVIDLDGDSKADYAYGGDLLGNMWKFDLTGTSASSWKVALSGSPLFTTKDGQPITGQPTVGLHPDGLIGVFVYFGTGKYIEQNDDNPNGQTTQSFYALWDKGLALGKFGGSGGPNLLQQSITEQKDTIISVEVDNGDGTTSTESKTVSIRQTSDHPINWSTHKGWYMELEHPSLGNLGEKQITKPLFRQGKIFFTTLVPSQAVCSSGGRSYLMSLCARNGGACSASFDLNEDGEFDNEDSVDGQNVAGVGSDSIGSGITTSVNGVTTIIAEDPSDPSGDGDGDGDGGGGGGGGDGDEPAQCGGNNLIHAYQSFSDGSLGHSILNRGSGSCGRQSWRMLRMR